MIRRIALLTATGCVAFGLFYVSRFWDFQLWDRPGLFGWSELPPQGGLVARWLQGTAAAPFEVLIWAIGVFLVLTVVQNLFDRISPGESGEDQD